MATSVAQMVPSTQLINQLLARFNDGDPDFRYMSISDLIAVLEKSKTDLLKHDYNTAARTVDHVVKALDDQNGEVQNQAKKCLSPLVRRIPTTLYAPLIEKLSTLKLENTADVSIPAVALKTVVEALPHPALGTAPSKEAGEAYQGISKVLIPRLLGHTSQAQKGVAAFRLPAHRKGMKDSNPDMFAEAVDVLIELVKCFGTMLQANEIESLTEAVFAIMNNSNSTASIRKKAVVALALLTSYTSDEQLAQFIARSQATLSASNATPLSRRCNLSLFGSMARAMPYRFGQHISTILPGVLDAVGESRLEQQLESMREDSDESKDFVEVCEAAFGAIEAFLVSCPAQVQPYAEQIIESSLRYINYDPNLAEDDEDDAMEDDGEDDEDNDEGSDDDFEADDEFESGDAFFDDDDDASWKVRRSAARTIYTLVSARSSGDLDDGLLYSSVAPKLIRRFDEREENVRLEIISALDLLIRKTGEGLSPSFSWETSSLESTQLPKGIKRRRQDSLGEPSLLDSNGFMSPTVEKLPSVGPRAELANLVPSIVKACAKQLKNSPLATKQAITILLDDLTLAQQGSLATSLSVIIPSVIGNVKVSAGANGSMSMATSRGAASATPITLRIASLRLIADLTRSISSSILEASLPSAISAVIAAIQDTFYKISSEALLTVGEIIKAITPPRSTNSSHQYGSEVTSIFNAVTERVAAADADAEVRHNAIRALGVLLARTSSQGAAGLLSAEQRQRAFGMLLERLKSETTRAASVQAVDVIAVSASSVHFDPIWYSDVLLELAAQVRKSNRTLRLSSIHALKDVTLSPAAAPTLQSNAISGVSAALQGVIHDNDPVLLGPALEILGTLASRDVEQIISPAVIAVICDLMKKSIVPSAVKPLIDLVCVIGKAGSGKGLMENLLREVGVNGDPATLGRVIGALLVSSGSSAGVNLDSFITESKQNASDPARVGLALSVLGEAGLRLGSASPLTPDLFMEKLGKGYDKVSLTAAQALGRAGAGNPTVYIPVVLQALQTKGAQQYLILQAIKELLQHDVDISSFSEPLWSRILETADSEDNKAVCAECLGRIAIIDPSQYVPKLDQLLKDDSTSIRGVTVQAIRSSLQDSGDSYDAILRNYLVGMLTTMLQDPDMETRRLGMTAFNSAAHNKPDLLLSHLAQLMPFVMKESVIKPELIREVQMGPFKHMVDDGLEVRKSAYETLYAMVELALQRTSVTQIFDRVVAGLRDDLDIRSLSNLMLTKLVVLDPNETARRLDSIAEAYRATLSTKPKANAVKQEIERQEDANKGVLRVTLLLGDKLRSATAMAGAASSVNGGGATSVNGAGHSQVWHKYWDWVNKDFEKQLQMLRQESEGSGRRDG